MNLGGEKLLSRNTYVSGRLIIVTSAAVLLAEYWDVDTSKLQLLNVELGGEVVGAASFVALSFLICSHLVHWTVDVVSLGFFNMSISRKGAETLIGGGGELRPKIDFILDNLESNLRSEKDISEAIENTSKRLNELKKSLWYFNVSALLYLVIWNLILPLAAGFWALRVLLNA